MADVPIKLHYDGQKFSADPDPADVNIGETISFELGEVPPNSTFEVTMKEPKFFFPRDPRGGGVTIRDSATEVVLLKAAAGIKPNGTTTYHCKLFDANGNVVAESTETLPGGRVKPG
jgi:hypothetical protein